jgi:hypothetical protein
MTVESRNFPTNLRGHVENVIEELEFYTNSPVNKWVAAPSFAMLEVVKFRLKHALEVEDARELHNDHGR